VTMKQSKPPGRFWAYTGAVLGGIVSVAANVAHSYIRPVTAPIGWRPETGAVVGAIVWPVFLFIAVEILARTAWPHGKAWTVLRFGGLLPVAAVAAFVSYRHLSGLLAHYGEEPIVFYLGPLAVDGLMIMATGALLAIHTRTTTVTVPVVPAVTPTTPGIPNPNPVPVPTSTLPPAPFVGVDPVPVPVPSPDPAPSMSVPTVSTLSVPTPVTPVPAAVTDTPAPVRNVVVPAPSTPDKPVTIVHRAANLQPLPTGLLDRARTIALDHQAATGTPITPGELAVRLRVGSTDATAILADITRTQVARLNGTAVKTGH